MVSCLSYYNSSLNLCWSVSIVQKQKPIMAEAQSCGRFARVTRPSDWSLDNQEVGRSQLNEGFFFFVAWVGVCVRLTVRPVSTCQQLYFVWKIETFHNDFFFPRAADLTGWRKRRYRRWMPHFSEQSSAVCAYSEDDACRQRQDGLALPVVPERGCVPLRADHVMFGRWCWSFISMFWFVKR